MMTEQNVEVMPLSTAESARSHIECALSVLKDRFPGIMTLMHQLSEEEAAEAGAEWIVDAFFVPSSVLLEFEDTIDDLSVALASEQAVKVLIISHTEEATFKYYIDMLEKIAPFELKNRGGTIEYLRIREPQSPPSWDIPDVPWLSVDVPWLSVSETADSGRKAA